MWRARAGIAVGALLVFARGVPGPLLPSWDDGRMIVDNADVQRVSWAHFVSIVSASHFEAYQPLHLLAYWLDVPWFGASGPVLHATNLVLWIGALWVVHALLRALGLSLLGATLATLAFGVHPVQVELVTWAAGRKDLVAIPLACGAWLLHLLGGHQQPAGRFGDRWAWGARALFALACLAKTTVVPLPLVMALADGLLRRVPWRRAFVMQLPSGAIAALAGASVALLWSDNELVRELPTQDLVTRVSLVSWTLTHSMLVACLPYAPSPLYVIVRDGVFDASAWIGPLACLALAALAWRRRSARLGFVLLAFLALLAPVSNLVPLYFQRQDRYVALPLLAIAFGLGAALDALPRRWAIGGAAALVLLLGARTVVYEGVWAGGEPSLWRYATEQQPGEMYAWLKLCEAERVRGDLPSAVAACTEATRRAPGLRLPEGARFHVTALSDEARIGARPSRAVELAEGYYARLDQAAPLRAFASELADAGYEDAAVVALERSLSLEPLPEARLLQAARAQRARGRERIARFFVSRLHEVPPDLRSEPPAQTPR